MIVEGVAVEVVAVVAASAIVRAGAAAARVEPGAEAMAAAVLAEMVHNASASGVVPRFRSQIVAAGAELVPLVAVLPKWTGHFAWQAEVQGSHDLTRPEEAPG